MSVPTHRYFIDLDELVEACRDKTSKRFMNEAVSCYRAQAYRASLVMVWQAIIFDLISKIRELALTGDQTAIQAEESIPSSESDVLAAQDFERSLLDRWEHFELYDKRQKRDLERIREDRHFCAHPSLTREGEPYEPPAELVRSHLRNAVEILLGHPPVQGQKAQEALEKDLRIPR